MSNILLTREEVFESIARHALDACLVCGVKNKGDVESIAVLGAKVYSIDPGAVLAKLRAMPTFIEQFGGSGDNDEQAVH